jgi:hypothetical protein
MHVGKLLASRRRKVSLAVHVAHAENVLPGLSGAADGVEAASSSVVMPSPPTALFTRAMGRKRPRASSSGACMEWIRLKKAGFEPTNLSRSDTLRVLFVYISL